MNFPNDDEIVHYVLPLVGLHHIVHALIVVWVFGEADFWHEKRPSMQKKIKNVLIPT
jgi:hypothetical protein